jgi:hypothetical protein
MVDRDGRNPSIEPTVSVGELASDGIRVLSLTEFATTWAVQRSKLAWLLGAGVSASAGVPLASSIRDRLLFDRYAVEHQLIRQDLDVSDPVQVQRIHAYFDGKHGMPPVGSAGDYSAAFELCLPDQSARKGLLSDLIEHVQPAFGQRVFGGLVVAGACDLVITTNFDRLIEQGISEAQRSGTDLDFSQRRELNVAGLDSTTRATTAIQERRWPLVVKLHGDFREKQLMNTDDELQAQDATLRQFVLDVSRQFGLVVSGYSGRDQSVMEMLVSSASSTDAWPHGIWWITRPGSPVSQTVAAFLGQAASKGVSANVVVAANFDETMTSLSRQVVVDDHMRNYFSQLHPKPRALPAAISGSTREWPVLRFNALPVLKAELEISRVTLPGGWPRARVREALMPRTTWPVVVSGPGEVICLGDPEAARAALSDTAKARDLPEPGPAQTVILDLLAEDAPPHHQTVLLQAMAYALAQVLPLWPRTDRSGVQELIVTEPSPNEPTSFGKIRATLGAAYDNDLTGQLDRKYGKTHDDRPRHWAEDIEIFYERRAGRHWLLFRPYTWIAPLPRPAQPSTAKRADLDPASPLRAEWWAKRRFNEKWAAIIDAWVSLLAPSDPTEVSVTAPGTNTSVGHIVLGRSSAYSRPA